MPARCETDDSSNKRGSTREEAVVRTQIRPPRRYVEAVKIVTSTLIIKATNYTDAEDAEKHIIKTTSEYRDSVRKTKQIKSRIKLICEALKIKET